MHSFTPLELAGLIIILAGSVIFVLSTIFSQVRPRKDHHGVDLISDALPFGGLWYGEPNLIENAIGYAQFYSRAQSAGDSRL